MADAAVAARVRDAVVDVYLAPGAGEAYGTAAFEGVDEVVADAAVEAGLVFAFVDVDLALRAGETWREG